ncbi:barstar family protein [Cutibacterium sp. V947]|uniref:barstar family protein n=1 Tax=Cutibacterium sp. V947 TaxID=3446480 RepID=UPI003EE0736F
MTTETDAQADPQAAGPIGSGIVLVDPASASDPSAVARVWRDAGWRIVDMAGGADLDAVLTGLGNALSFPSWFGHNLDALHDCLADVEGDTAVLWTGWQPFQRENPQDWGRLVDVIGQRLDEDDLDGFALLLV